MRLICPIAAATAALATACAAVLPARATPGGCGFSAYSYAGVVGNKTRYGISAQITTVRRPIVAKGHVAAWVGLGGFGLGPDHTDEWLQVGIGATPAGGASLYYEVALPNQAPHHVMLKGHLPMHRPYTVAVVESSDHSGSWLVWVNETKMTQPIALPGSHGVLRPVVTAESWNGDASGTCNTYAFRFAHVRVAAKPGGNWQPITGQVLADAGYRLEHEGRDTLLAFRG